MNLKDTKTIRLLDYCTVERAKKNKLYDAGSILLQVSASKGQLLYLKKTGVVESKYAVITVSEIDSEYLYYVMKHEMPKFLTQYQTGINIKPEVLKYFKLHIHNEKETQKHIAEVMRGIEKLESLEQMMIGKLQEKKKIDLREMFP